MISDQLSVISDQTRRILCAVLLGVAPLFTSAQEKPLIPESEIAALQEELAQGVRGTTTVDVRRACKSVIRKAQNLVAAAPEAENRTSVLAIIFQGQKKLLSVESTEQNRNDIFETCTQLLQAPEPYVELRLEADMVLSERDHALKNATVEERVKALEEMVARYSGTRAEWRSLTIASLIAPKLLAFELEQKLREQMAERFGGDHDVIAFRRKSLSVECLDVVFSGTYKSSEGLSLTFPYDRLGHQALAVFWSTQAEGYETFLKRIKEQQERFPAQFEVYSFNTDELPDAGSQILQKLGLNGTALHLPGGKNSTAYLAYAQTDLVALLVNGQGHIQIEQGKVVPWNEPTPARGKKAAPQDPGLGLLLDSDRYLAQLRYLLNGDFLLATLDTPSSSTIPEETLRALQSCFVSAPSYYRLSPKEALVNYQKAEKLCAEALQKYPQAPDLWVVRNRRIIALLGLWNQAREPKHLDEAVKEARATLAVKVPSGAEVVSHFCLAKEALRKGEGDPQKILARILEATGGPKAPASALAAVAVLAIEANARTPYGSYRERLLALKEDDQPRLWPVLSFMRDRLHTYRLFCGNLGRYTESRHEKYMFRQWISGVAEREGLRRVFSAELRKLDGGVLSFPKDTSGKLLGVLVVEPSGDKVSRDTLAARVSELADEYVSQDVQVVVAFLSGDTQAITSFAQQIEPAVQAVMVPEGLRDSLVLRHGILSADLNPNQILLRPDGSIAWMASGMIYEGFSKSESANKIAIGINIEKIKMDEAFTTLERGDFKKALQLFSERLPPKKGKDWWVADCLQARALACMGLKDWNAALTEIDAAFKQRIEDFEATKPCSCHGTVEIRLTKAAILDQLGQTKEAVAERQLAAASANPHPFFPLGIERMGVPIGVYYDTLKKLRLVQVDVGGIKK